MKFPIPKFVPVPSTEIMQIISMVSLIVGICLVGIGFLFLFLYKRNIFNKNEEKENNATVLWICIGVGALLIANHSIQLLF